MAVSSLIKALASFEEFPVDIEKHVMPEFKKLGVKDEIWFFPDDKLDPRVLRGNIEQYEIPDGFDGPMLDADGRPIRNAADITYAAQMDEPWQRLVCCKELVHLLDPDLTRSSSNEEIESLIEKIVLPADLQDPFSDGLPALTDRVAEIYATALLFPLAQRDILLPLLTAEKITLTKIADMMELPLRSVALVMSDQWPSMHDMMTADSRPFRVVLHILSSDGSLSERQVLAGRLKGRSAAEAAAEAQAVRHAQHGFDDVNGHWWLIDDKGRRCHVVLERGIA